MDRATVCSFMQGQRYGVVSCVSRGGEPQSALVGVVTTVEMEIIFDTVKTSRKYANLIEHPACSFVMGWADERSLQFEGVAMEPTGSEHRRCQEIYFAAWPDGPARMNWPEIAYFVVQPRWIRYSDYGQTPPLIEEIIFP